MMLFVKIVVLLTIYKLMERVLHVKILSTIVFLVLLILNTLFVKIVQVDTIILLEANVVNAMKTAKNVTVQILTNVRNVSKEVICI